MSRFLVTGLPRSRTAWFAVATGAVHEPISHQGYPAWRGQWDDGLGVSDSGAIPHLAEIMDDFSPKTLIVLRHPDAVCDSMMAYAKGHVESQFVREAAWKLFLAQRRVQHPLIKRISYDALGDLTVMEECLDWLGVKVRHLAQLMHMRIESDLAWNLAQLRKAA